MSLHGGDIWSLAESHGLAPGAVLDFSSSLNPLGLPASVRRLMAEPPDWAVPYPDAEYRALRQGLGEWLGLPPGQLAVGNGASELIRELLLVLRPRRIMVIEPGFAEYARAARGLGIAVAAHRLEADRDFRLDTQELEPVLDRERPDLLFVCNPNNPTSRQIGAAEMAELARASEERGIWLVVDETFIELSRQGTAASVLPLLGAGPGGLPLRRPAERLVVVRALTKVFALAGLRLGCLAAGAGLAARVRDSLVPWSVNGLAARLGGIFAAETDYLEATRRWMAEEPDWLHQGLCALAGLERVWKPDGNFVLARLAGGRSAAWLRETLLEQAILIRDAGNFAGLDQRYFRVAVRQRSDNRRLLAALAGAVAAGAGG